PLSSRHWAAPAASYPLSLHVALPISQVAFPGRTHGQSALAQQRLGLDVGTGLVADVHRLLHREGHQHVIVFQTDLLDLADLQARSEEHTSELQSRFDLVCRLLLEKNK